MPADGRRKSGEIPAQFIPAVMGDENRISIGIIHPEKGGRRFESESEYRYLQITG